MKKALSLILSMLILILSAVPCNDEADGLTSSSPDIVLTVQHAPDAAFDICNPFFFCHTGHSAFMPAENFLISFHSITIRLFTEPLVFHMIPVRHAIWQPPKA